MQNYDNVNNIHLEAGYGIVQYTLNGEIHRTDGPAEIQYHSDGTIVEEIYYINGQIHREDGPAMIWYKEDGTIEEESYYLHDIPIRDF